MCRYKIWQLFAATSQRFFVRLIEPHVNWDFALQQM
jgi:hypothetical protein